jgi:hypothetical protein
VKWWHRSLVHGPSRDANTKGHSEHERGIKENIQNSFQSSSSWRSGKASFSESHAPFLVDGGHGTWHRPLYCSGPTSVRADASSSFRAFPSPRTQDSILNSSSTILILHPSPPPSTRWRSAPSAWRPLVPSCCRRLTTSIRWPLSSSPHSPFPHFIMRLSSI